MAKKPRKPRIKVSTETIKLRMEFDVNNQEWYKLLPDERKKRGMNRRPFSLEEGSKLFGISYKKFWRWQESKEDATPSKKKCSSCGISAYMRVAKWINDGTLDHLIKGVAK